jgi:hypothetical protein
LPFAQVATVLVVTALVATTPIATALVASCSGCDYWLWLSFALVATALVATALTATTLVTVGKHSLCVLRTFVRGDVRPPNQYKQISPFSGYMLSQVCLTVCRWSY